MKTARHESHNDMLLRVLSDGQWHTAYELYNLNVMVHSRIADLRKRGHAIECDKSNPQLGTKGYKYRLNANTSVQ